MTEKHGSPNGFPPAHQERLEQGREAGKPFFKKDSPSSSSSSKNTLIVGVGTLISRLLGFVRDAGIAWLLGGSGAADALTAALRIPYMARRLFGEGTLSLSLTAACTRERLRGMEKKTATIEEKMEEIRLVNRAKWLLIRELHMDEPQAHRYIEKQAMDRCVSKRTIAEEIVKTYS